ncbi:unnamed protein product [Cyprideis torosa]|uniref:SOWAHA-C winged helix-turn-helix domain-containing protein n=1 Tax=Cyprideis torosa TaxID=163714 RepID=A0A7R8WPB6_9CRUS|nr:unnamed protein product [Cyprideis torosa]CAG0901609.1 unnamed protein product [Cyprideis torosa]
MQLTEECVRDFIARNGGEVLNKDLVRHFRGFFADPASKEDAKQVFKQLVNAVACMKIIGGEKYVVLRSHLSSPPVHSYHQVSPPLNYENANIYSQPQPLPPRINYPYAVGLPAPPPKGAPPPPPPYRPPPRRPPPPPASAPPYNAQPPNPYEVGLPPAPAHRDSYRYDQPPPKPPPVSDRDVGLPVPPPRMRSSGNLKDPATSPPPHPHHHGTLTRRSSGEAPEVPPRKRSSPSIAPPPRIYAPSHLKQSQSISDITAPEDGHAPSRTMTMKPFAATNAPMTLTRRHSELDVTDSDSQLVNMSVRQRTEQFNKIASSSQLIDSASPPGAVVGVAAARKGMAPQPPVRPSPEYLSSLKICPKVMASLRLALAKQDYPVVAKMLKENTDLAHKRDHITGYCPLHWAAKHGNGDLVKLMAGYHRVDVDARTLSGYTALHLAAQFGRSNVYDLLSNAFSADAKLRDFSGKKPIAYLKKSKLAVSADTASRIRDRRADRVAGNSLQVPGDTGTFQRSDGGVRESVRFPRIGSINVRVKKTAEAFGRSVTNSWHKASGGGSPQINHSDSLKARWNSTDNVRKMSDNSFRRTLNGDSANGPPSSLFGGVIRKRKSKRGEEFNRPPSLEISCPMPIEDSQQYFNKRYSSASAFSSDGSDTGRGSMTSLKP